MATGSCQGMMKTIATTEILPWLQHAAVVIDGKNGAGALHTRIRPVSVMLRPIAIRQIFVNTVLDQSLYHLNSS
jgi:hypothetical protein